MEYIYVLLHLGPIADRLSDSDFLSKVGEPMKNVEFNGKEYGVVYKLNTFSINCTPNEIKEAIVEQWGLDSEEFALRPKVSKYGTLSEDDVHIRYMPYNENVDYMLMREVKMEDEEEGLERELVGKLVPYLEFKSQEEVDGVTTNMAALHLQYSDSDSEPEEEHYIAHEDLLNEGDGLATEDLQPVSDRPHN
ncbi:hypothetical protein GGI21_003553 [Coemansia aciculifera]|nr:hypothetical protein GGI21_003553 [Coemansia aciculifera]